MKLIFKIKWLEKKIKNWKLKIIKDSNPKICKKLVDFQVVFFVSMNTQLRLFLSYIHTAIFYDFFSRPPWNNCEWNSRLNVTQEISQSNSFVEKRAHFLWMKHNKFISNFLLTQCSINCLIFFLTWKCHHRKNHEWICSALYNGAPHKKSIRDRVSGFYKFSFYVYCSMERRRRKKSLGGSCEWKK